MLRDDWVMFIPANGDGTRVADRGPKHAIMLPEGVSSLVKVAMMAPRPMQLEIAVRNGTVFDAVQGMTIHTMDETIGQAGTIYEWLRRTRKRQFVLISNCDNWIDPASIKLGMRLLEDGRATCVVPTFRPLDAKDRRFSYIKKRTGSTLGIVVEHNPVSDQAVAGVYMVVMEHLLAALMPDDIYLSQTLSRFPDIYTFQVEQYMGWGDMDQLNEIEQGITQYRVE